MIVVTPIFIFSAKITSAIFKLIMNFLTSETPDVVKYLYVVFVSMTIGKGLFCLLHNVSKAVH